MNESAGDSNGDNSSKGSGLSRRQLLRAAVPVGAGLVGAFVGAATMFNAASDGSTPRPTRKIPATTPAPIKTAPIPTTSDVLLVFTRPDLDPRLEPIARGHRATRSTSLVRGGIADLVLTRDGEGGVVDQTEPGWIIPLEAIAVDPEVHAGFASKADGASLAGLADGQALLGRSSAVLRRLTPGATLELAGGVQLLVAGIVEDSSIGAAELAVTTATGAALGLTGSRYMLISHDSGARDNLEAAMRAPLDADVEPTPVRFRAPGETPILRQGEAVLAPVQLKERFGEFTLMRCEGGCGQEDVFEQEPAWKSENLITRDFPLIPRPMTCHRGIVEPLQGALDELISLNLGGLINQAPDAFQGCYNPRFVRNNPYDISRHAWAVALDLNFQANRTGSEGLQDPRLVDVFARWGFTEGGNWLRPDPGHFEYVGRRDQPAS